MQPSDLAKLKLRFPISPGCAEINSADGLSSGAEPEQAVRQEPLGAAHGEEKNPGRCKVSIISYRKKPVDPDNLCPKYFIDALRYCGVIEDDTARHIVLEVSQQKVWSKSCERTEILIEPLIE